MTGNIWNYKVYKVDGCVVPQDIDVKFDNDEKTGTWGGEVTIGEKKYPLDNTIGSTIRTYRAIIDYINNANGWTTSTGMQYLIYSYGV